MQEASAERAAAATAASRKVRVLVIAEAANPEWASVPLVGWSLCEALTHHVDAHVVTQVRNRAAMERAGWVHGQQFTALDTEWIASGVSKLSERLREAGLGWTTSTALSAVPYYAFEQALWSSFGERIRRREFDLVHRVTPLTPIAPSLIAGRCRRAGVPFVWGPINGGVPWPAAFDQVRRREGEWLSYVRGAYRLLPGYGATRRHAAAILVGSRATAGEISPRHRDRCVYMPENGIDPRRFPAVRRDPVTRPLRAAFVGRLVPYKGADMLIEAAAPLLKAGDLVLDVIGDGPELGRLRALIGREGVEGAVEMPGWVPHERVFEHLQRADVLAFPSVREFGGGVVLEAMAMGLVPIVANYAGPAELVTDATGYRVDVDSREGLVAGLRSRLQEVVRDPSDLRAMGERARARALSLFTWDAKAAQVAQVYDWVLGRRPRPDFGF